MAEIVATKPRAHWMNALEANDAPFAPVNSLADVLDDPQVRHLRTFYKRAIRPRARSPPSTGRC